MLGSTGARRWALLVALLVRALAAGGCGGEDFANDARPGDVVIVSAVITPRGVSVSPSRVGAGLIELRASNQTSRSQRVQLRSQRLASGGRPLAQTTGPISPGGVATLKAGVDEGTYTVTTRSAGAGPASLVVAAQRRSAP